MISTTTQLAPPWRPVETGDDTIAVAERDAWGTTARVAVWPPQRRGAAVAAVDGVLRSMDRQASRFREDSEICWLHSRGGGVFMLSDGLAEAIRVALAAAEWTGGLVDPSVGAALIDLGYDRDFASVAPDLPQPAIAGVPAPGWRSVVLEGSLLHLPAGVRLDLGATAKGLGSDRAAAAVRSAIGPDGGVLVSLGGDVAVAGTSPADGWPMQVSDTPDPGAAAATQLIRLTDGGLATSSTTCRRWRRDGRILHHIVDPRTGDPAGGPWQTVSVAAATCADANAAATGAIVAGTGAEEWLASTGLAARMVTPEGRILRLGGWPEASGGQVPVRPGSRVYAAGGVR
ncbi:MAG TPA: FAD:protein FMN transferase [Mycobacteriales bacterium]|nr:FAD:protein FMN transferase [Mycobacteriales bacterium]